MKPLISVIIPVYNGEAFVKNCIESIREQNYNNLQIIVIDDGSRDQTLSILHELASEDTRIEVIHQENGGVSKARNTGLTVVRGEWVLFVDADDVIASDYCSSMIDAAQSLSVDVLIARPHTESQEEKYLLNATQKLVQACLSFDEVSFSFNIDAPWGKLFRASTIKENHIRFPEALTRSEDAYFCMWFYECSKSIGILNEFGYSHIEREGSLCRRFASNAMQTLEVVLMENKKWVEEYHPNELEYNHSLWYRVLPGIVECEKAYFLHPDNHYTHFQIARTYQRFLNQPMVRKAIKRLKMSDVMNKQYRLRLVFYKLRLGWLFILAKRR